MLRANLSRNDCESRVEIHEVAVGREQGSARFSLGEKGQTGWGGLSPDGETSEMVVPVTTLDEVIGPNTIVDVLKIDVEGADTWVLQGAKNLLKQRRLRRIYFEQNFVRMKALRIRENEAADFLQALGYRLSVFSRKGMGIVDWEAHPAE